MSTATLKRNSIEPPSSFWRIVNKYVSLSFTDFHQTHQPYFAQEKPVWDKSLSIFFDIVFFLSPLFHGRNWQGHKKEGIPSAAIFSDRLLEEL